MSDNWLQNYESSKNYAQEINQKINEFKKQPSGSTQRAKGSATIRKMVTEFERDVEKLSSDLTIQSRNGIITAKEANRRRTLVDAIKQSKEEIEKTMRESFNGTGPRDPIDPRFISTTENDQTQNLTNEELSGIRSNLRDNNDRAIEALHEAVKRQKEIGHAMNTEVDRHNEIIDTITDKTGLLSARVKQQTILTKTITRKSSACCLWVLIVLLFIAIIVIVSVPFS